MAPIANGLNVIQGQNYMYLGYYTPTICMVKKQIESIANLLYSESLKRAVLTGLINRFSDIDDHFYLKAAFLLPKHKRTFYLFSKEKVKDSIMRSLENEIMNYDIKPEIKPDIYQPSPAKKSKEMSSYEKLFGESAEAIERSLIQQFNWDESREFNVFNNCNKRFNLLKPLFIKYNTILPSSAPVESLFCVAKDAIRQKRSKLTELDIEKNLLLKANKKYLD